MRNAYLQQQCDFASRFRILKGGKISLVVSALIAGSTMSFASPTGGVLNSGSATITQTGSVTTINQSTQKASINWQNFSIASNETVNFNQPNSSAVTLNRVVGNEKSVINGALNANGQVFILNSNGVLFGKDSSVNTAGLVASTMNITDANFMNGKYTFESTGSSASVINLGTIHVTDGAYVALLGKTVANEGLIQATKGTVALTAGDKVSLNFNGDSLVGIAIDQGTLNALVENKGAIIADGGKIFLTSQAANDLLNGVVNNTGVLQANSLDDVTGHIEIFAHGGTANVGGTIEAQGGFVETSGKEFTIAEGTTVKAGKWLIDPVNITIDSTLAGTIETALGSGDVTITTDGHNTPDALNAESGTDGDITVNSAISWSSAQTLTLSAYRSIFINARITASNANGKVALLYGQGNPNGATGISTYSFGLSSTGFTGSIYLQAGQNFSTKEGNNGAVIDYTVITDLGVESDATSGTNQTLQGMARGANLAGNYVLGANIDASATFDWNSGEGFTPIGDNTNQFIGRFDGLGHTVYQLGINRPAAIHQGLFGVTNMDAYVRNIGLEDISITGNRFVGGLVGVNYGNIVTSYVTGDVGGDSITGGLAGVNNGGIMLSYANASVDGTGALGYIGGLVGNNNGGILYSYATGNVTGTTEVGGLVGHIGNGLIMDTYATGSVTGDSRGGGLVGYMAGGSITKSYSTGAVSGATDIGGLVGKKDGGSVTNSFWDTQTSHRSTSAAGTGKTTQEMSDIGTYTGWDIAIQDSSNPYPSLTMNLARNVWTIPVSTPPPPPAGDTPTAETETEKVITAIINTNTVHIEVPHTVHEQLRVEVPRPVTYSGGKEISLVSSPSEGQSVQRVSTEEVVALQKSSQSSNGDSSASTVQETRVALYQDSVVDLVNGGVSLPEGVHQEFYVVKNDANTNTTIDKEAN